MEALLPLVVGVFREVGGKQGCVEGWPQNQRDGEGPRGLPAPEGRGAASRGFSDPEREPTVCVQGSPRLLGAYLVVASTEALPQHRPGSIRPWCKAKPRWPPGSLPVSWSHADPSEVSLGLQAWREALRSSLPHTCLHGCAGCGPPDWPQAELPLTKVRPPPPPPPPSTAPEEPVELGRRRWEDRGQRSAEGTCPPRTAWQR